MKFVPSKLRPLIGLITLLILSFTANSQRIQPSSVSCTDSVRAISRAWFAQKSRADTLNKALTDTTLNFRHYRCQAVARQDSIYQVGYQTGRKDGKKEGKAYGRKQVLGLQAVLIVLGTVAKVFVFNK